MARAIWLPGGGGADLDVVTADAGDVLAGKVIVGPDGEPLTGTLALSGNASDGQVLSGQTYYNTDAKTKRTGTMPNRGAVNQSLAINGSYTIPAGFHNGSGKVTQDIPTKGAQTYTPGTTNQTIAAGQYLTGAQTIKGDPNLKPENIKKGVSIMGITGTHDGFVPGPMDIYNRGSWGSGYSTNDISAILGDSSLDTANVQYCTATKTAESAALRFDFNRSKGGYQTSLYGICRLSKLINFAPYKSINFIVSKVLGRHEDEYSSDWKDLALNAYIVSQSNAQLSVKEYFYGGKRGSSAAVSDPSGEVTASIDLSAINVSGYLSIVLYHLSRDSKWGENSESHSAYLNRLWFT